MCIKLYKPIPNFIKGTCGGAWCDRQGIGKAENCFDSDDCPDECRKRGYQNGGHCGSFLWLTCWCNE